MSADYNIRRVNYPPTLRDGLLSVDGQQGWLLNNPASLPSPFGGRTPTSGSIFPILLLGGGKAKIVGSVPYYDNPDFQIGEPKIHARTVSNGSIEMYIPPSRPGITGIYELAHYCQPSISRTTSTFFWGLTNEHGGLTEDGLTNRAVMIISNENHSLVIFDTTLSPDPFDIRRALRSGDGHYGPYTANALRQLSEMVQ